MLFQLFKEVILSIGAKNIMQVVTDNAANYKKAGELIEGEFPTISWSPCAAHCLNLMFNDIGKLEEVKEIVTQASSISKYAYNHCFVLSLMRKYTNNKELLRPAPTRFATNFIAIQSILCHKDELRAMVVSREWTQSSYARDVKGRKFVNNILDLEFWKACTLLVRITDSDERPAMGYLYASMHQARDEMLKRFQRKKTIIEPYKKINDHRWDKQLHKKLHLVGFWFNSKYHYDVELMKKHNNSKSAILDVIEKYVNGDMGLNDRLTREMKLFKNAESDFGRNGYRES